MTGHDVLVGALNIIDTDGWASGGDWMLPEEGRACAYFAVGRASKPHGHRYFSAYMEALDALAEVIGCEPDPVVIGEWNDAPERTVEEVRGVLIEAIALLAPAPDPTFVYADA